MFSDGFKLQNLQIWIFQGIKIQGDHLIRQIVRYAQPTVEHERFDYQISEWQILAAPLQIVLKMNS